MPRWSILTGEVKNDAADDDDILFECIIGWMKINVWNFSIIYIVFIILIFVLHIYLTIIFIPFQTIKHVVSILHISEMMQEYKININ